MHVKTWLPWFTQQKKTKIPQKPTETAKKRKKNKWKLSKKHLKKCKTNDTVPEMFKLNTDCVHEICEWLSLKDLNALGQTCRAMKSIVSEYITWTYPAVNTILRRDRIEVFSSTKATIVFPDTIKRILIAESDFNNNRLKFIATRCTSLEQIQFKFTNLTAEHIVCLKKVLENLRVLRFVKVAFRGDFYEDFLKHCQKLTTLSVRSGSGTLIGFNNNWMLRHYPHLKHIEMSQLNGAKIDELQTFFDLNPQIETLGVNSSLLQENQSAFIETRKTFVDLAIIINYVPSRNYPAFFRLLNELHKNGFYRRLHLYTFSFNEETFFQMAGLRGLVKLYSAHSILGNRVLSPMLSLTELSVDSSEHLADIQTLAKNLKNLQRILFYRASYDDIVPFFRYAINLKVVNIRRMIGVGSDEIVLDVRALNNARKQLASASKVNIYVKEQMFLNTKFAMDTINYPKVEMKRIESMEWQHYFLN